jgi:hypothetical protein
MRFQKLIRRRIREQRDGVSIASDLNVAVSGNVGERGGVTHVSSQQRRAPDEATEHDEQLQEREEQ